ncbi:MAG: S8 family serine peptidase [Fimbriimonadales bacterium]|nr:S8 family serine peptidase [Fimbriimonadales bacterium]
MKSVWRWLAGMFVAIHCAGAQTLTPDDVVPGELLLRLKPGRTVDTARVIANSINAEAIPIEVQDTYLLRLRNRHNVAPAKLLEQVQDAIRRLEQHSDVLYIEPNYLRQCHDIPNDPFFPLQWALEMMRMPAAWDIQKADPAIRIAFIDDNFQRTHPDLRGIYDALSRNFAAEQPNDNINPEGFGFSHGTSTVGVAAALTNNGTGIAGLTWQSPLPENATARPIVGLKVEARPARFLSFVNILRAYQYVIDNAQNIHVLNMSYGGYFFSSQENALIQQIYQRGVVPVASAGNNNTDLPAYPANYDGVVTVSAVGPTGERAFYSNYGNIDLAAPGGDQSADAADGVLTTSSLPSLYNYVQGTSYSGPYVAAAVALLLATGNVRRHTADTVEPEAVTILKETADPRGRPVPDPELGFGIINLEQALRGISGVNIAFLEPTSGATFDTRQIRVRVSLRRVQNNSTTNILNVRLNGDPLPRTVWEPSAVIDVSRKTIALSFVVALPGEGRHTISIEAVGQDGVTGSNSVRVITKAYRQNPGLAMFSVPYSITRTPEEVFGNEVLLARYLTDQGTYARYSVANRDPRASFNPPGVAVRPDGSNNPTPPRGLGYFLRASTPTFILGDEAIDTNTAYLIPLQEGWNMIGNPFPFNVPWAACEVEILGAGGQVQRLNLQEAADRGYIRLQIYRYIPLTGEYTWRTAPLGELIAWQAHWVKALRPCTLVVPPVGSLRSRAEESTRVVPEQTDGWLLRLIARSGDREDANNLIGATTQANDELGREDVEKPPVFQSYVALHILEPRTRSALAQDLRRATKRPQRWELEITTDQPNAEVTLQWVQERSLPRGMRLTLVDQTTGERVSMLQTSSYRFRTDENSRRRFTVEAQPARASQLRITNVSITQTRGDQFTIQYALSGDATVQVLIQDAGGRTLARLPSGARSAGVGTAAWNGRTDTGIAVPPGTYQVQIIATGEEGEVARVARPLVITR